MSINRYLIILIFFRRFLNKEDPIRYKEKLSQINVPRNGGFLIWFHMASVGEAMSILPLIEGCVEEKKVDRILLTSITLSSSKILEKRFNSKIIFNLDNHFSLHEPEISLIDENFLHDGKIEKKNKINDL